MGAGGIRQNRNPRLRELICRPLRDITWNLTQRIGVTDRHPAAKPDRLRAPRDLLDFEHTEQIAVVQMDVDADAMTLRDVEDSIEMSRDIPVVASRIETSDKIGPVAAFKLAITEARLPKTRSGKILRGTIKKIADGEPWTMPATIEDPAVLDEIKTALQGRT